MDLSVIHYSSEFKKLIEDKKKIQSIIKRNQVIDVDFEKWTKVRFLISTTINIKGSILNIKK